MNDIVYNIIVDIYGLLLIAVMMWNCKKKSKAALIVTSILSVLILIGGIVIWI